MTEYFVSVPRQSRMFSQEYRTSDVITDARVHQPMHVVTRVSSSSEAIATAIVPDGIGMRSG